MVSNPSRFREYGQGLILDVQEGLARVESVVTTLDTSADSTRQRAFSELNEAFELLDKRMRLKCNKSNTKSNTDTTSKTFTLPTAHLVTETRVGSRNPTLVAVVDRTEPEVQRADLVERLLVQAWKPIRRRLKLPDTSNEIYRVD